MVSLLQRLWRSGIVSNLVTGSLVLLPLVLTVIIIGWIVNLVTTMLGPSTWFGRLLTTGGHVIAGDNRELVSFLVGASFALAAIWFLGLVVRAKARHALAATLDGVLSKVPLFQAVYRPVSQVVRLFVGSDADLSGMPVVMCRLGGPAGADVPALLASKTVFDVGGGARLLVYLPTSPLPAWGGLVLVPEESVIPVPGMDADALIKLYFSFGVLGPEVIPMSARREGAAHGPSD